MKKILMLGLLIGLMAVMLMPRANAGISEGYEATYTFNDGTKIRTYYYSSYGRGAWRITDDKDLIIQVSLLENPMNYSIIVEHMYALCTVEAKREAVDGIKQDEMSDYPHTGLVGFKMEKDYPYEEKFAIEGYSKFLIEGWIFACQYWGWGSITENRLDETRIKERGQAVGSGFQIVFDICKVDSKDGIPTLTKLGIIKDSFIVYFDGTFQYNEGGSAETILKRIYPLENYALTILVIGIAMIVAGILVGWKVNETLGWILIIIGIILLCIAVACALLYTEIEIPQNT